MIQDLKNKHEYLDGRTASMEMVCAFLVERLPPADQNELLSRLNDVLKKFAPSTSDNYRAGFQAGVVVIKGVTIPS